MIRALRNPTKRALLWPALALVLGLVLAFPASESSGLAQTDSGRMLPREQTDQTLLREKAVDVLTRATLNRLRSVPDPTREHFRATALALRIIRRLAPDDVDLLRLEIEAWSTAGDEEEALAQTRALLRLDPRDEVAQLRVAVAGFEGLHDVDSRLAAYNRVLGPRGQAIDSAVRSRLALDAALLARDNGDDEAYLSYLTTAMSLDATNKGAAALFGTYVLGRTEDPLERVEVLCNIILADPLDSGAWENLALELLSRGAYAGALRAFSVGTQIAIARGWTMTPERVFDFALCEWRVKGPVAALGRINKVVQDSLMAEQRERARAIAEGLEDPGPPRPLYLPPELDLMRLAIAVSQKSEEGVKSVLDSYLTASAVQIKQFETKSNLTPQALQRADGVLATLKLQRLWALLFARQRVEEAQQLFDELTGPDAQDENTDDNPDDAAIASDDASDAAATGDDATTSGQPALAPEVIQRFRGWLAMVNGQDRDAEALLAPLVEQDTSARWAMAVLREQQGNEREAMLHFARLATQNPRSALGMAAWYRLMGLRGGPVAPGEEVRALDEYVMAFAPWINTMASDPAAFMSLRVRHEDPVVDPLGVVKVDVTVRNVSGWPLAVGPESPIPKRLMLAPSLRLKGLDASSATDPVVALIQNRLRLRPAEEVTVVVTPTRAQLGSLLDITPGAVASLRWQGVQGFIKGAAPGFKAGSMTVTTLSDVAIRQPQDDSIGNDELAARIQSLDGADLVRAVQLARRRIVDTMPPDADPQAARTLMDAITDRLPTMEPLAQAIVLVWLGEAGIGRNSEFDPTIRAAIPDPTTDPALALLLEFVSKPDDPLLAALIASNDDDLSRLAFIERELCRAANGAPADEVQPPPDSSTP